MNVFTVVASKFFELPLVLCDNLFKKCRCVRETLPHQIDYLMSRKFRVGSSKWIKCDLLWDLVKRSSRANRLNHQNYSWCWKTSFDGGIVFDAGWPAACNGLALKHITTEKFISFVTLLDDYGSFGWCAFRFQQQHIHNRTTRHSLNSSASAYKVISFPTVFDRMHLAFAALFYLFEWFIF